MSSLFISERGIMGVTWSLRTSEKNAETYRSFSSSASVGCLSVNVFLQTVLDLGKLNEL